MRKEETPGDVRDLSFIEKARRAQIVACAIDTIAEVGYAQASLAKIARRAGISKGVISYHFAGKDELIQQVVVEVLNTGVAFMLPKIKAETTAAGALRAYIASNLAFMREYRNHILALLEIWSHYRPGSGSDHDVSNWFETTVRGLEEILRWGQESGEFRAFSTRVMAIAIRNAIDGIPPQMAACADLDLNAYTRELVTLFDLATRNQS